jgi:hypothetical protein
VVNWPSTLPQVFLYSDFVEQPGDNLLASENSIGPAKLRRRTTSTPSMIAGSMVLSQTQKVEFKTFATSTLSSCGKAFNFPDPDGGSDLLVRLKPDYSFTPFGVQWKVALELEVLP